MTVKDLLPNKKELVILVIAGIIGAFSFSPMHFALSAWIWPALLLYLTRSQTVKKAIFCSILAMIIAFGIGYGYVFYETFLAIMDAPITLIFTVITSIIVGAVLSVPFILDRLMFGRMGKIQTMLFFPFVYASFEFLVSYLPIGSLTSIAYSQIGFLPLLQGLSVFGTFGITFLIGWFATSVWMIYNDYISEKNWRSIDWRSCICIAVILIIIISGAVRLTEPTSDERIEVFSTCGPYNIGEVKVADPVLSVSIDAFDYSMSKAAENNADIIVTTEEAYNVKDTDLQKFIDHAVESSKKYDIPVLFGIRVTTDLETNLNQAILITPENGLEWKYSKVHTLPFAEDDTVPGNDIASASETEFGKLSTVICFDLDFPHFVNKLPSDLDILASIAWDWEPLTEWRTDSCSYRAIENGFSFLKVTMNGMNGSYDKYGNAVQKYTNFPSSANEYTIITVPTDSCVTFYGQYGQIIDLLYIIGAAVILLSCMITTESRHRFRF